MRITVTMAEAKDLTEALTQEGVNYQECALGSTRELNTGSWQTFDIQANLPEVNVPPEVSGGDIGGRAYQLPSGRLIIVNGDGDLEQITTPLPRR